jgi:anthranilate synthase/aminodeoxychorismate synthase-like glutamine amidotransferase
MSLILIDNYDSFTYNLVQYFAELGQKPLVYRHDQITVRDLRAAAPQWLVISPGPGGPTQAGVSCAAIEAFAGSIPILGVCLGLQCIAAVFGGTIGRAAEPVHGKTSEIRHDGQGFFQRLPNPLRVMRYHSLIVQSDTLTAELHVSAVTEDHIIMGLRHAEYSIEGVQFHPESVLSEHGKTLLQNFLNYSGGRHHETTTVLR